MCVDNKWQSLPGKVLVLILACWESLQELGRQPAMTKLGAKRVHTVRVRGGNTKHRAMRLETGNYAWGSEHCTRKTRLLTVVYNSSNNELVRTNTLVKNSIIQIDATPFRQWYEAHYGQPVSRKRVVSLPFTRSM